MYRLGIDVGGTNTDAIILNENLELIAAAKMPTTEDIQTGIHEAIKAVLAIKEIPRELITFAMLGTTQCTNAIVERKKLGKVGILRLGYPATVAVEPMIAWPQELIDIIGNNYEIVHGGYEFNGAVLSELDETELTKVLGEYKGKIDSLAIVGVFSSLKEEQELKVGEIAKQILGEEIPISYSHKIGSVGLIERENATILNAALYQVIAACTDGFVAALHAEGITKAQQYLCQNDGTLMALEYARQFPILTIACGPTNSIRGAAYLSGYKDALILDVGGTTSDIGVIANGFPRESSVAVEIGDVRTNFRMPDIISIGIGGGSIVRQHDDGSVTVGPDSVGYEITKHALVFGGTVLTATDIAVKLGMCEIGDSNKLADLDINVAQAAYDYIADTIADAIDKMKTSVGAVEVILVGGGSVIIPRNIKGVKNLIVPENNAVANAIGASIAQVSGQYEKIVLFSEKPREEALKEAEAKATEIAIAAGAMAESISVVEIEEIPLAYYPGNAVKLKLKVVGNLS